MNKYSRESSIRFLKSRFPVAGRLYEFFLTAGKFKEDYYVRIESPGFELDPKDPNILNLFTTSFYWSNTEEALRSIYGDGANNVATLLSACHQTVSASKDVDQNYIMGVFNGSSLKPMSKDIPRCCSKEFFAHPKLPPPWDTIVKIIKDGSYSLGSSDSKLLLIAQRICP